MKVEDKEWVKVDTGHPHGYRPDVAEFYTLRTPRDLLDKAKREYSKLQATPSTDTVFNFFVTAYHVIDYVKVLATVSPTFIDSMYADDDFKLCQFLCNKGKHLELRKPAPYGAKHEPAVEGGTLGTFLLGADRLGGPERYIVVVDDSEEIDVVELGKRLLDKWEKFFADNHIP